MRWPAIAAAIIAASTSGCTRKHGIAHSCGATGASPDREAIVFARDGALVRRRGGRDTAVRGACLSGMPQTVFVSADGNRAIVYGTRSNVDFDLWGHSGRHVSVACLVDFEAGVARAAVGLESVNESSRERLEIREGKRGNLYAWRPERPGSGVEIVEPDRALRHRLQPGTDSDRCVLGEDGAVLRIACVPRWSRSGGNRLTVTRYDARAWPPRRLASAGIELLAFESLWGVEMSRDGHRLAYWGRDGYGKSLVSHLGVIDLERGEHLVQLRETFGGAVATVELDGAGQSFSVGDWLDTGGTGLDGRVRSFDRRGKLIGTRRLDDSPTAIYQTADRMWVNTGCQLYAFEI